MSSKSQRGKRRKGKRRTLASARQPAVAPVSQEAPAFKLPARTPIAPPPIPQYSHVARELKRIGIIAGAMFLILIILTFALS